MLSGCSPIKGGPLALSGQMDFVDSKPGFSPLRRRLERDCLGKPMAGSAERSGRSYEERGSLSQGTQTFLPLSETLNQDRPMTAQTNK